MANTTINAKTNKTGLINFIRESATAVKDKNLISRIKYTLKGVEKNEAEVSKSDLYALAKEIMSFIAPAPQPVVENSPKPKLNKKKVAEPAPEEVENAKNGEEATEKDAVSEEAPAPKKTVKKTVSKKTAPAVETTESITKKDLPLAKMFPATIDHESLGKLVACPDKYTTVEEVRKALDEGKTIVFAGYWTKRHIKEFSYGQSFNVPVPKEGFPNDLDIIQALYVCDGIERIYALSIYTEAMYRFEAEELERTECEANDGSKFTMRYSSGMEYEIYEVSEAE